MKKLLLLCISLLLVVSCNKETKMDADVKSDISSAPVADRASVLLAIPIVIAVTELTDLEKSNLISDYESKLSALALLKIEQRQVVTTIIDKLTIEEYSVKKMQQLTDRHGSLEAKISKLKTDYLKSFIKSVQGKITEASVELSIKRLEEHYN